MVGGYREELIGNTIFRGRPESNEARADGNARSSRRFGASLNGNVPPSGGMNVLGVAAFLAAFLSFASCATSPPAAPPDVEGEFSRLDPGGLIYLSADIPKIRPILEELSLPGMIRENAVMIMDITESVVAAAYPLAEGSSGSSRNYLLFARGNYPKGRIDFSFTLSKSWKRAASGKRKYWRSAGAGGNGVQGGGRGISLAVERDWALLSDGDPFVETSGVEAPPAYGALRNKAASAGWLPQGGTILNNLLISMELPLRIPAELILFALYPLEEERYQAHFRLETENPALARGLVSMLNLARTFARGNMPELEGTSALLMNILLANPPEQDGAALTLKTNSMDARAIALLFNILLINFNNRGDSQTTLENAR